MKVVVLGNDHYNTYGIIRSLGEKGINCDAIVLHQKNHNSFVLRSKYIEQGYGCMTYAEVSSIIDEYHGNDNVVICCSDEAVELIVEHYDDWKSRFVLPVCGNYNETTRLMNKDIITDVAQKYGLNVPMTWKVVNRQRPNGITFPCITKPLTSTGGHKSDIVICHNEEELCSIIEDIRRCPDFVVQELISYEKEVSILGAVLANGEVIFSGCIDKLRTCMIGTTSFGKMVSNNILGENVKNLAEMMKGTRYKGLFSAEFLLKDGIYYFLEVNFRNDGNTYVATASGQNLPFLYVQSFRGGKNEGQCFPKYPCFFMLDIEDFLTLKKNHVSLREWNNDRRLVNSYLVYNERDIKPFIKKAMNTASLLVRRAWHKIV